MIRWLHISDLHIRDVETADQFNLNETLLKSCREGIIKVDFVVATGDFRYITDKEGYKKSSHFLHELMDALKLDISSDLFMVPGNHDAEKSVGRDGKIAAFLKNATEGTEFNDDSTPEQIDAGRDYVTKLTDELAANLADDFQEYRELAASLIPLYEKSDSNYIDPVKAHVRTYNGKINILHLNTALLSDGKRGHLEATDIIRSCNPDLWDEIDTSLPTIVLGHHSFHDLHNTIKDRLRQMFNHTNVWAYLAGDKHQTNYKGDEYLIDRGVEVKAWPNIIAGTMGAVDDGYSEMSIISYCWDEQSQVYPKYLFWEPGQSGDEMEAHSRNAGRPFPMRADINSELYYDLVERLAEVRKDHPSFQLMEIDDDLFPKAKLNLEDYQVSNDGIDKAEKTCLLSQVFKESWNTNKQNHLMLEGEGGIGKTVALLSLTTKKGMLPHHVPAIYIPLHALKCETFPDGIAQYILDRVLQNNLQNLDMLKKLANQKWEQGPRMILLMDGFNEIASGLRRLVGANIEEWSDKPGVQIICASRFDMKSYLPNVINKYNTVRLQTLTRKQVRLFLKKADVLFPNDESIIWEVINYPLMLAIYLRIEKLKNMNDKDLEWKDIKGAGTLIWNYLQKELYRFKQQMKTSSQLTWCVIATEYVAPFIAWRMGQKQQFIITEETFIEEIAVSLKELEKTGCSNLPPHIRKIIYREGICSLPNEIQLYDLLTKGLNLFRLQDSNDGIIIRLMHQQFRDCLAAIHLINSATTISKDRSMPKEWELSIDYYVMNFIAELIPTTTADKLWEINRTAIPTNVMVTRTMLELQKRIKNYNFSKLNFSEIDLRKISLFEYREPEKNIIFLPKTSDQFDKTQISLGTFSTNGHSQPINMVAITPDCTRCVSASKDCTLRLWDMDKGICLAVMREHSAVISAVTISPDSTKCVSASLDGCLYIWDISFEKCGLKPLKLIGHTRKITSVSIDCNSKYCLSSSLDCTLKVWDLNTGEPFFSLSSEYSCLEFTYTKSNQNNIGYIIGGSSVGIIYIWEIFNKKCLLEKKPLDAKLIKCNCHIRDSLYYNLYILIRHNSPISMIIADKGICISACTDGLLELWDMNKKTHIDLKQNVSPVLAVSASKKDYKLCMSREINSFLSIWNKEKGDYEDRFKEFSSINGIAISPNGTFCLSKGNNIITGSVYTKRSKDKKIEVSSDIINFTITQDGRHCVCALADCSLVFINLQTGMLLFSTYSTNKAYQHKEIYSFLENNNYILFQSSDSIIEVWDIEVGKRIHFFRVLSISPPLNQIVDESFHDPGLFRKITRRIKLKDEYANEEFWIYDTEYSRIDEEEHIKEHIADILTNFGRVFQLKLRLCYNFHTDIYYIPNSNYCLQNNCQGEIIKLDNRSKERLSILRSINHTSLHQINLSKAIITPPEYAETLYQNGAVVAGYSDSDECH